MGDADDIDDDHDGEPVTTSDARARAIVEQASQPTQQPISEPDASDEISPYARAILRHRLCGWSDERIAAELRVSEETVYRVRRAERIDDIVDHYRAGRSREHRIALEAATAKAMIAVQELIEDEDPKVRLEATKVALATAANGSTIATIDASTSDAVRAVAAPIRSASRVVEASDEAEREAIIERAREARRALMQGGGGRDNGAMGPIPRGGQLGPSKPLTRRR